MQSILKLTLTQNQCRFSIDQLQNQIVGMSERKLTEFFRLFSFFAIDKPIIFDKI